MPARIRIRNVTSVSASIINVLVGVAFISLVIDYWEIYSTGYFGRLQFRSVPLDVGGIIWGVIMLVYGMGVLVRYFRGKPVPVVMPIAFFLVHVALYATSFVYG